MKINAKKAGSVLLIALCIIFILTDISVFFITHDHQCSNPDCEICATIQIISSCAYLCAIIALLFSDIDANVSVLNNIRTSRGRDSTPVGLKVKLSN